MYNGWSESEIRMLYREAKDKAQQILILTQLTGLRTFQIEQILEEGGYLNNMTDLMKNRILQLYDQELSDSAIGRELGVAQSQVSTFLRKKGLPPNGRRKKKEDKKVPEIKEDTKIAITELVDENKVEPVKAKAEEIIKNLKEETKKNIEQIKEVLPKQAPDPDVLPIDYVLPEVTQENTQEWKIGEAIDLVETLTPTQYYELAKLTFEILKGIWGC